MLHAKLDEKNLNPNHPIGIFDSGVGGLTVMHAITELLPQENVVYFGDTAHVPWGEKSPAAIQTFAVKICEVLLAKRCKIIVIACNTASALAHDLIQEYVGVRAHVVDVIQPTAKYIAQHFKNANVGLIGTKQTIRSNVYQKELDAYGQNIHLKPLATPLLVPLIEEGYHQHGLSAEIIHEYLAHESLNQIQALIMGCTHYPVIRGIVENFYAQKSVQVPVFDSSQVTAQKVAELLKAYGLENTANIQSKTYPLRQAYVSDHTEYFAKATEIFYPQGIALEPYPLWN
ncbi:MAG: glutamate racemase [Gammaproteobacteria bacterium]